MRIRVRLERIVEEVCDFEAYNEKEAKQEAEALTNDDFRELDSHFRIGVYRLEGYGENLKEIEITGQIQPNMKNIGV